MTEHIAPKSLVVVFGAGASKEVNLPLGAELTKEIAGSLKIFEDDYGAARPACARVYAAMELLSRLPGGLQGNMGPYIQAAHDIRRGMSLAPSIDNFIDVHRDKPKIAECGRTMLNSFSTTVATPLKCFGRAAPSRMCCKSEGSTTKVCGSG